VTIPLEHDDGPSRCSRGIVHSTIAFVTLRRRSSKPAGARSTMPRTSSLSRGLRTPARVGDHGHNAEEDCFPV
jgi:hypothetical protein